MNDTLLFAQIASAGALPDDVMRRFERRARLRKYVEKATQRHVLALLSSASRAEVLKASFWLFCWARIELRLIEGGMH